MAILIFGYVSFGILAGSVSNLLSHILDRNFDLLVKFNAVVFYLFTGTIGSLIGSSPFLIDFTLSTLDLKQQVKDNLISNSHFMDVTSTGVGAFLSFILACILTSLIVGIIKQSQLKKSQNQAFKSDV